MNCNGVSVLIGCIFIILKGRDSNVEVKWSNFKSC